MSIRNEDSLNCPCNGIYKCGFHSEAPKLFVVGHPPAEVVDDILKHVSPGMKGVKIIPGWEGLHLANLDLKEFDK